MSCFTATPSKRQRNLKTEISLRSENESNENESLATAEKVEKHAAITTNFAFVFEDNSVKVKSAYEPIVTHQVGTYPGFYSMKRLGVFQLPPWMGCIAGFPSIKFAGTHSYTWVETGTVRVKYLAQEHNTMSPARARARTARSGVERTNHEATAPPTTRSRKSHYYYPYVIVCEKLRFQNVFRLHHDVNSSGLKTVPSAPFSVWISVEGRPKLGNIEASVFKFLQHSVNEHSPAVTISLPVHGHAQVQLSWRISRFLPRQIS